LCNNLIVIILFGRVKIDVVVIAVVDVVDEVPINLDLIFIL